MKTKLFSLLVALMSLAPCYSKPLTIWMKNAFQRGHARIPSITNVDVDYDNEVLTVNVQNYTETVWIYIYDINGNIIDSAASQITGEGTVTLNVQDFPEGVYTIDIVLCNATYEGTFNVAS